MKHIKVKVSYLKDQPNDFQVEMVILEQTHKCSEFGEDGSRFTYNGFSIGSYSFPEYIPGWAPELCMRGSETVRELEPAYMSLETWQKAKAAIKAYNEYFA